MEVKLFLTSSPPICPISTARSSRSLVSSLKNDSESAPDRKIIWQRKLAGRFRSRDGNGDCLSLPEKLSRKRMSRQLEGLSHEMVVNGFLPTMPTLCALMLYYADNGLFPQAQTIWDQLINSSFVPSLQLISKLFDAYGKHGHFDEVMKILRYMNSRNFDILPDIYSLAVTCLGRGGQLKLMEDILKEMVSRGFRVDSLTGNTFLKYYSIFGSLEEMENAYGRLKRSRILIEKEAIRSMALAYMKEYKFYELGEFVRDVGLGRKNEGNLLWNLLLLSYAANFKMKSLQREFLRMVEAGFCPDVTTFNIRALAFSRMQLFWDLHLSIEHMMHENVVPDLVTYGCVVDAYLDRRIGKNLDFALNKMNPGDYPQVSTDPFVFEALGKGDFHLSSEAFLEFKTQTQWTYRDLILRYLRKHYRRNQIFWNY
ncbi:pentatricopeptide repeat-containing protein At3g42630 isoform X2 [Neltuma alba]|uniref:pentatricopeptide repeat-containing protein At3g42630 isoform X2 n=1 Tax=Neltuma alba TaxID=207710 RepID=UPI0010A36EB7|nr:pentatricopeptide repeat-containing protein At3g42630 isoform X2 [Prosopis alba]